MTRLPPDLTLRAATPADVAALAALKLRCEATHGAWAAQAPRIPAVAQEELEWHQRLAVRDAWTRCAVDQGERIVAVASWGQAREQRGAGPPIPGLAHVSAVFVDPDRWRQGIARAMVKLAEESIREHGFDRAQLWTLEGSPAEQLYSALGWRRDGRREQYAPLDLPMVAYVKPLAHDGARDRTSP